MGNNVSVPDELVAEVLRFYISDKYVDAKLFCYWCMVLTRSVCSIHRVANICKMVFVDESLAHKHLTEIIKNNDLHFYNVFTGSVNTHIYLNIKTQIINRRIGNQSLFNYIIDRIRHGYINPTEFKSYIDYESTLIHGKNNYSWTVLMYACLNDCKGVVSLLIQAGANINEKNDDGRTALMIACIKNHTEIADRLIQAGANINEKSINGLTVLMIACDCHRTETADRLIQAGANIHEKDNYGRTALWFTKRHNHAGTINLLLTAGATE